MSLAKVEVEKQNYTSPNGADTRGTQQGIFDESWWRRLFKWETLIVAGREVKGWVVPQPLGVALIVTVLGVGGYMYKSNAADVREQRDLLIRLDQRLIDKNAHDQERYQRMEQRIDDTQGHQRAVETVMNSKLADLKAELKPRR